MQYLSPLEIHQNCQGEYQQGGKYVEGKDDNTGCRKIMLLLLVIERPVFLKRLPGKYCTDDAAHDAYVLGDFENKFVAHGLPGFTYSPYVLQDKKHGPETQQYKYQVHQ
jgi:hypothetical protein